MSWIKLTKTEAEAVEEALVYANEELKAAEEQTEFVLTSGAKELIIQALIIMRVANKHTENLTEKELQQAYDSEKEVEEALDFSGEDYFESEDFDPFDENGVRES